MVTQFRPTGSGPNDPMYCPDRDLANCWPTLMRIAMQQLDPDRQTAYLKAACAALDVTDKDLADASAKLAATFSRIIDADTPRTWVDATKETGYCDVPYGVQRVMHAAIGDVFLGATFEAIVQSIRLEAPPANHEELAKMVAAGRRLAMRIHPDALLPEGICEPSDPPPYEIALEEMRLELGLARARDAAYEERVNEAMSELEYLRKQLREANADMNTIRGDSRGVA